ncbi:MAG: methylornithine synthase PylB [Deltaproteobacteria bacterium]|jgi:methylornithine synthase|nr:methylornithine synthase PylB [Deltaproteobacteria bacterium]
MRPEYLYCLEKAGAAGPLDAAEIATLLSPACAGERERLREEARRARDARGGGLVYTYGFVYLSTFCRNDCSFCSWRRSNREPRRYRKTAAEVVEAAASLAAQGVDLIDLTMGEDPEVETRGYLEATAELIRAVREASGLPVMISPGLVPAEGLGLFREAGALWYACYQETHSPSLFGVLRPGQSYGARWGAKREARRAGLLVEEGVLCGVGESPLDLARSVLAMGELGAAQVRAMAFVPPQEAGGRARGRPGPSPLARDRELDMIAVLRLSFPEALIPASLDVEGLAGLPGRLDAGANLVTSLVPAELGLAGVAQDELDIENDGRSLSAVLPLLEGMGLRAATPGEYLEKAGALA